VVSIAWLTEIQGKFYSLTSTVLTSIKHDTQAVFPVDPSKEEMKIINHFKTPAFILGRSGTGKTTCLIYKMVSRYLTAKAEDDNPVRQVSTSPPECLTLSSVIGMAGVMVDVATRCVARSRYWLTMWVTVTSAIPLQLRSLQ